MANEQNLKPFRKGEVSRELAVKGQKASAQKRKQNNAERKAVREMFEEMLQKNGYRDVQEWMINLSERAKENTKDMEFALAIMGEKPKEQVEISQEKPFEVTIEVI